MTCQYQVLSCDCRGIQLAQSPLQLFLTALWIGEIVRGRRASAHIAMDRGPQRRFTTYYLQRAFDYRIYGVDLSTLFFLDWTWRNWQDRPVAKVGALQRTEEGSRRRRFKESLI